MDNDHLTHIQIVEALEITRTLSHIEYKKDILVFVHLLSKGHM